MNMNKFNFDKIAADIRSKQPIEQKISEYKLFYKKYLRNIVKRDDILKELSVIKDIYQNLEPKLLINKNSDYYEAKRDALKVFNKYFPDEIYRLFNKEIEIPKLTQDINNGYSTLLMEREFKVVS